jgi:hypothetical protein
VLRSSHSGSITLSDDIFWSDDQQVLKSSRTLVIVTALFLMAASAAGVGFLVQYYEPQQWEANEEAKSQTHQHSADILASERVAYYTKILATFSGALAAISAVQIYFLIRADNRAAEAAEIANKQMLLAGRQADVLERQQGLAHAQYYVSNRPKIVLKEVFFTKDDVFDEITYELVNTGGTLGKVISGFVGVAFVDDFREFRAGVEAQHFSDEFEIGPGAAVLRTINFAGLTGAALSLTRARGLGMRTDGMFFYGRLIYIDERGIERGTARLSVFRRRWDEGARTFVRTHEDHEYAD